VRVRSERARSLEAADQLQAERFVRNSPTPRALPTVGWINPPTAKPIAVAQ
jgi:hypothetical protein